MNDTDVTLIMWAARHKSEAEYALHRERVSAVVAEVSLDLRQHQRRACELAELQGIGGIPRRPTNNPYYWYKIHHVPLPSEKDIAARSLDYGIAPLPKYGPSDDQYVTEHCRPLAVQGRAIVEITERASKEVERAQINHARCLVDQILEEKLKGIK